MYFCYFVIISPWKRVGPFIWTNLYPLHARMRCAKFGWNCPSGSGEEDENVKSLRKQRRQRKTDKFGSEKYTWAFGSGELKNDVNTSENYIHFSDINLTSRWQLGELTRYKNKILSYQFWCFFLTSGDNDMTSWYK